MRKYFVLVLAIAISLPICAKQPATQSAPAPKSAAQQLPADAATREQLMELFDVLEVTQQMNSVLETMQKTMRQAAPSNLSDQQKADLAKLDKELYVKIMNSDLLSNLVDAMIPVYQRHFTHADVDAIITFYSSPVGQKLLHEQSQIMQEIMPKAMTQTQQQMQGILKDMNYEQRMQQILDQGHAANTPSPK